MGEFLHFFNQVLSLSLGWMHMLMGSLPCNDRFLVSQKEVGNIRNYKFRVAGYKRALGGLERRGKFKFNEGRFHFNASFNLNFMFCRCGGLTND